MFSEWISFLWKSFLRFFAEKRPANNIKICTATRFEELSDHIENVNFTGMNLISLKPLEKCTQIKNISFSENDIRDLAPLKNMKNIGWMQCDLNTSLNFRGIEYLHHFLVHLHCRYTSMTNKDFRYVGQLVNLETLNCANNLLGPDLCGIQTLKKLKWLNITSNEKIRSCKGMPMSDPLMVCHDIYALKDFHKIEDVHEISGTMKFEILRELIVRPEKQKSYFSWIFIENIIKLYNFF